MLPEVLRVLGPHERGRFSPEAWGSLVSRSRAGAWSLAEFEGIVDRLLSETDGRVERQDIEALVAGPDEAPAPHGTTVH